MNDLKLIQDALADGRWHTSKDVERSTRLPSAAVRAAIGGDPDQTVISSNLGYRLYSASTPDERYHCFFALRSRAWEIAKRAKLLKARLAADGVPPELL